MPEEDCSGQDFSICKWQKSNMNQLEPIKKKERKKRRGTPHTSVTSEGWHWLYSQLRLGPKSAHEASLSICFAFLLYSASYISMTCKFFLAKLPSFFQGRILIWLPLWLVWLKIIYWYIKKHPNTCWLKIQTFLLFTYDSEVCARHVRDSSSLLHVTPAWGSSIGAQGFTSWTLLPCKLVLFVGWKLSWGCWMEDSVLLHMTSPHD